jgi:hypothetical protein
MEQLPALKYGKPSAVISGIDLSSNGGPLTRPGTT